MSDTTATSTPTATDMHMRRVFDAPRSLVFDAWTKEEHLLQWFGPHSYPVVRWTHDFRPGGSFAYTMRGPDGVEVSGGGEYVDIVPGERIVGRSRIEDGGVVIFEVVQTYTFADAPNGGTDFTIDVDVVLDRDFPGRAGMEQGWSETLDRLGEYVEATRA